MAQSWLYNNIPRPSVGADLSRPPPIYRPPQTHPHVWVNKLMLIIGPYTLWRIIHLKAWLTPQHAQQTLPVASSSDSRVAPTQHRHHPSRHTSASERNHLQGLPPLLHSTYSPTPYAAHEN